MGRTVSSGKKAATLSDKKTICLKWQTASGKERENEYPLSKWDQHYIEEKSGLPVNGNNRDIASRLNIPLSVLIAYQKSVGINVKRREKAYRMAITRAILLTREMGFPLDQVSNSAVLFDPHKMLI